LQNKTLQVFEKSAAYRKIFAHHEDHEGHEGLGMMKTPNFVLFVSFVVTNNQRYF
jgi:hypothetical protein